MIIDCRLLDPPSPLGERLCPVAAKWLFALEPDAGMREGTLTVSIRKRPH